ncbi:alpha/beta fold hydrolase [Alteromonas sp. ASW11-130]|uniref:alpha/beta fold hydrolase n=1 Tax=Alteromonas sp. ASW11-130 TaxID=3015775 RepID=UPI0022422DDC|nr:alpha/beta hydrolase [Alteromonas sp. ASW11-130]
MFKHLSDHLSQQGIANFRFDDRGVGDSSGHFPTSTLQHHVSDVNAIIKYFKRYVGHPFSDFILLGHSQGGIVSARVAIDNKDIRKVILMGAPAVPLIDLVLYQLRRDREESFIPLHIVEREVSAHNKLMFSIAKAKDLSPVMEEFELATYASLEAENQHQAASNKQRLSKAVASSAKEYKTIYALPSLTSFLYHDTSEDYQKLNVPVLSLFGGKDRQVTFAQNKDVMEKALLLSGTDYTFVTFDNANHYFQKAKNGDRSEQGTLENRFIDGFLESISQWIID